MPGQEADYKAQFIQAVAWLKSNDLQTFPAEDPRSYLTWKRILQLHQLSCQHSNWFLLPWHRLYVVYFESACQMALQDANFALPYWDWTADGRVPDEFYTHSVLQERRDLLQGASVPAELVGETVMKRIMSSDDFFNFHSYPATTFPFGFPQVGAFESMPHNGVHNTVGGFMGSTTDSPTDPLFWLHHCNVDRCWDLWLTQHPASVLPFTLATDKDIASGNTWANTVVSLDQSEWLPIVPPIRPAPAIPSGVNQRGAVSTMKPKDLIQTSVFGYVYDTAATPVLTNVVLPQESATRFLKQVNGTVNRTDSSAAGSFRIPVDVLTAFTNSREARVRAVISDVPTPKDGTTRRATRLRVFAADSGTVRADYLAETAFELPDYVGGHSYFPKGHHAAKDTVDLGFDLSAWLRQRLARGNATEVFIVIVAVLADGSGQSVPVFVGSAGVSMGLQFALLTK